MSRLQKRGKTKYKKRIRKIFLYFSLFLLISSIAYATYYNVTITWKTANPDIAITLSHPIQGDEINTNTTNFTWSGTGGDGTTLEYVLYADTQSDFTSPFKRTIDTGTVYDYTPTPFMDGKWYWRVEGTDGSDVNISETWNVTIRTNATNNFPSLSDMDVSPTTGYIDTTFTYTVNFTDADNDSADFVNVTIDLVNYSMIETNASDTDTTDGKLYNYTTTLNLGTHNYSFSCSDGISVNSTERYTNPVVGEHKTPPSVSNEDPTNNSEGIDNATTTLSIYLSDSEGHTMNWTIETSPDIGSSSGNDETNGTKTCTVSGLDYNTTYTWYVNVSDIYNTTNVTFSFKTEIEPFFTISSVFPLNGSTNVQLQPYLYATFNHTQGLNMNISWYYGLSEGNETIFLGFDNDIVNSTQNELFYTAINHSTNYFWRIQVDDGINVGNRTYHFMTDSDVSFISGGSSAGIVGIVGIIGVVGLIFVMTSRKRRY